MGLDIWLYNSFLIVYIFSIFMFYIIILACLIVECFLFILNRIEILEKYYYGRPNGFCYLCDKELRLIMYVT